MNELVFEIRDAEEGGFNARALGKAILRKPKLGKNYARMLWKRLNVTTTRQPSNQN